MDSTEAMKRHRFRATRVNTRTPRIDALQRLHHGCVPRRPTTEEITLATADLVRDDLLVRSQTLFPFRCELFDRRLYVFTVAPLGLRSKFSGAFAELPISARCRLMGRLKAGTREFSLVPVRLISSLRFAGVCHVRQSCCKPPHSRYLGAILPPVWFARRLPTLAERHR